jgi:integrase
MATVERRRGGFRLVFWYRGHRFQGAIKAEDERDADRTRARVERNLQLLQEGRIEYRPGDDLFTVMLSDGKLNAKVEVAERLNLGEFFKHYQDNRPPGKERNTAYTEDIHVKHLLRLLGEKTHLTDVPGKLQGYVNARSKEQSRLGGTVSQVTIKKELGTLTGLWNGWATAEGLVHAPLTLRRLQYPKKDEKEPFQTWEQIQRRIARGNLTEDEQAEVWDALFLTVPQVEELLAYVRATGCLIRPNRPRRTFPWVYPMFAFVAYTGARRSEMLRSRLEDLDFEGDKVRIREKKKDRRVKETFRDLLMVPRLKEALQEWLKAHPGGPYTFCKNAGEPFSEQMATHYLRWTLDGSNWRVVRGWHVLRHSLISNMVSRGVPERVLMAVAGHLNAETSRRYQHLLPSTVEDAMRLVFGLGERAPLAEQG